VKEVTHNLRNLTNATLITKNLVKQIWQRKRGRQKSELPITLKATCQQAIMQLYVNALMDLYALV